MLSPGVSLDRGMKNSERPEEAFFTSSRGVVRARRIMFVATSAELIQLILLDMYGEGGRAEVTSFDR